jgi:hypothetical protein
MRKKNLDRIRPEEKILMPTTEKKETSKKKKKVDKLTPLKNPN